MAGLAAGSVLAPVLVAGFGLIGAVLGVAAILPIVVALGWRRLGDLERRARGARARDRAAPARPDLPAATGAWNWRPSPDGRTGSTSPPGGPADPGRGARETFYVLAAGALHVERGGEPLREVTRTGDGGGEIAILRGVPRTASVIATEASTLLAIDRAPFLAAVTGHPDAFAAADAIVSRAPSRPLSLTLRALIPII